MNSSFEHFPLIDALDHEILMHREAHFGGQFSIMLDYYRQGGKGVQPDFDLARMERLAAVEGQLNQNLAALVLEGYEIQKVADARQMYQSLREIYEVKNPKNPFPRLIGDLILSEEAEPETEMNALVERKEQSVPALIDLLCNEELYDPLFPGYGLAPSLAVECLGRIGDKRAIIALFQVLGQGDFFADDQILKAFKAIGDPARAFLLRVLQRRPFNEDNERAAIALVPFQEEDEVAGAAFALLQQPDVQADPCLPGYLVLICSGLKEAKQRQRFVEMAQGEGGEGLSKALKQDMKSIIQEWEGGKNSF